MSAVPLSVWLWAGYALLLAAVAWLLERLAARAHRRTHAYELAGFRYHPDYDHWVCPEGTTLQRDLQRSLPHRLHYRAPAARCQRCHRRPDCTDSPGGRTLEWDLAAWLETQTGRFHRGLSLGLLGIAAVLLGVQAAVHPVPAALAVLLPLLALTAAAGVRLAHSLRAQPPAENLSAPPAAVPLLQAVRKGSSSALGPYTDGTGTSFSRR
jgi:hypothetical protein